MRKVAFIIDGISNSGGTDRVLSILSSSLVNFGLNTDVYSLSGNENYYPIDEKVTIKYHTGNRLLNIFKILKSISKDPNTVVIVISMGKLSVQIALIKSIFRIKNRFICSDHVSLGSFSKVIKFIKILSYRSYTKLVVLTNNDKVYLKKKKLLKGKNIKVIRNISPYIFKGLQYTTKYKTVVAIGRLSYQKNFSKLLDIWKNTKTEDWKLIIVGSGEEYLILEKKILDENIKKVKILPATKNIEDIYMQSTIIAMTSRYEGLPMVLIEAKSFGIPVIAFDCKTGPNEIINGDGYLIKYGDDEDFTKKLEAMINDESILYDMSKKTIENSLHYTEDHIVKKWMELIE